LSPDDLGDWIKDKASEVKKYLKRLEKLERLGQTRDFENPKKMLK